MHYSHLSFDVDTSLTGQANICLVLQARILPHLLVMQQERVLGAIGITSNLGQEWINSCSSIGNEAPFPIH